MTGRADGFSADASKQADTSQQSNPERSNPTGEQGTPGADHLRTDDVRVLAGNPTAEEIAVATAVLTALISEKSNADAELLEPIPSAWQRSQRPIRGPIQPGPGRWRGFAG